MASFGANTVKYAIFLLNLLIMIFSIVLIAAGGVMLNNIYANSIGETIDTPKTSCILLIVVGTVALIISFIGCCGAVKESFQLLYTYGTILFILFVIELVATGAIIGFRNDIKHEAIEGIKEKMRDYPHEWENKTSDYNVIDDMQRSLHCCGAESINDWHEVPPYNATGPVNWQYPSSCCNGTLPGDDCRFIHAYKTPCWQAIETELKDCSKTLIGFSIAIAVVQFLAMVSACVLARTYKQQYEVV